jgi:hypothetical protein
MGARTDSDLSEARASIHLHLGAHKTATTYIQAQLHHNARTLAADGVAYVPMREFRSWRRSLLRFGARFSGPPHIKFDRRLRLWNPERRETCIISDENVIGTCGDIVSSGTLYPKLRPKLSVVAGMLSGHPVRLFLSIRCYASFYAAAYCEALRYGTGCSAETFKQRLDPELRRWRDVLADIAELFPASPIVVWPYESFRQSETGIFDALAGKEIASKLRLSGDVLRPSLSQGTVDRVQQLGRRLGWVVAGHLVPIFQSRDGEDRPFDPWTNAERTELQKLYAGDLAEIGRDSRYRIIADNRGLALSASAERHL